MAVDSRLETILAQLVTDLETELAAYQSKVPSDNASTASPSNTPSVAKANNVIDYLVAQIHSEFTEAADDLLATGILDQEQRIAISHAIGLALDAFNTTVDSAPNLFILRNRPTTVDSLAKATATEAPAAPLVNVTIINKADERRLSYGIAYPAQPLGWSDTQGDWCSPAEIEKMAHDFMAHSQRYDMHHANFDIAKDAAVLVESYIAPVDLTWTLPTGASKQINKGSWIVVTHYPDPAVWSRVKAGEFNAYSIHGRGKRKPLVVN